MSSDGDKTVDVLHLDMDCFFAAVEAIDNPELLNEPVIVGGTSERGVVASASYEARAYGVHAAMPTITAKRCCPEGIFISPSHGRYGEMNRRLLEIIERVTPIYEPIAFDEAFIDVSGAHRLFGDSLAIAYFLRSTVASELGLTCSVGVARTKLIAKLASKAAKPRVRMSDSSPRRPIVEPGVGVRMIEEDEESRFLLSHPLRALPGVGPKTMARLQSFGISTIADAAEAGRDRLQHLLGDHQGTFIAEFIEGRDPRRVEPNRDTRSIGSETTFSRDLYDHADLASRIRELSVVTSSRARANDALGRTVSLKIRFRDLTIVTRRKTSDRPFTNAGEISEVAIGLLDDAACERGIRLLGVHLSNFVDQSQTSGEQLMFFGEPQADIDTAAQVQRDDLDAARDEIRRRYGDRSLDSLSVLGRRTQHPEGKTQA